jgi:hypothetical protein
MAAFVSLLMVMGCPTTSDDSTTGSNVNPAVVTHTAQSSPTTTAGTTVTGTVLGAGNAPQTGKTVTLTDARAIQVPNSGDATTDGSGKFTLKQVPASSTWLVLADVDGNRMAGVVKPNTKKTVDCKITLTTTLAISGIQPYFVEDPKAPDRVVYDLRDLPLDKFDALVAAIDNSQSKPEIKPSPRIKDLNGTFTSLKDKDPAVKAAFDALFQQIQLNALIRQAGGTPDPNAKTPVPGGSNSPSPSPTSTVSLSTPVPTPTPTPTPSGLGTPTPVPTKNYSPINVTLTTDTMTLNSTAPAIGAGKLTANGQSVLLIPDDTKIRVLGTLPVDIPDIDPSTLLGGATVTGMSQIAVNGTKAYTIAMVNGAANLITLQVNDTFQATASTLPITAGSGLTDITKVSGLVWSSVKGSLFASDADHHVVVRFDVNTGNYSLYAGINNKSDTPGTTLSAAAGYGLNTPSGLTEHDSNIWVCDAGNHRLLTIGTSTDLAGVYSGKNDSPGSVAGAALSVARYQKPVSVMQFNNAMYMADSDDNCVRVINLDIKKLDSYILTGPKTDNNQFIFKCRMVAELGGKIYAANGSGKIVHFDPPTFPN